MRITQTSSRAPALTADGPEVGVRNGRRIKSLTGSALTDYYICMGQKPAPAPGGEGKIIIGQKVMKFKKYLWIALAVILALIALRFWLNSRKKETSGGPGGRRSA